MNTIMMKLAEHAYMAKEAISTNAITKAFSSRMARIGKAQGPMQDMLKGRTYKQLFDMNRSFGPTAKHSPTLKALRNTVVDNGFMGSGDRGRNFIVDKMTNAYNTGNPASGNKLTQMLRWSR